ncbi:unnamed protein product, partial [Ectocarpus fasciculatus]
ASHFLTHKEGRGGRATTTTLQSFRRNTHTPPRRRVCGRSCDDSVPSPACRSTETYNQHPGGHSTNNSDKKTLTGTNEDRPSFQVPGQTKRYCKDHKPAAAVSTNKVKYDGFGRRRDVRRPAAGDVIYIF